MESPGVAPGVQDPFGLPRTSSAAHYRAFIKSEIAKWAKVVKASGARAD